MERQNKALNLLEDLTIDDQSCPRTSSGNNCFLYDKKRDHWEPGSSGYSICSFWLFTKSINISFSYPVFIYPGDVNKIRNGKTWRKTLGNFDQDVEGFVVTDRAQSDTLATTVFGSVPSLLC
jgi:hypothetical protein